ncbi:hypothetical protein NDU88_008843 [Pleurodeles waltl]|uniref:Uncharacterized protein n=1 Tax=Pleurodeles waltl TaxID=8319 RepID=A0AAV7PQC0_PLEWA|nr:hypothetical protein NDU88_008843 [Pleurodeles waltl]
MASLTYDPVENFGEELELTPETLLTSVLMEWNSVALGHDREPRPIPADDRVGLEAEILQEETFIAIKGLAISKTLRGDVFPPEFYQSYSDILSDCLLKVYLEVGMSASLLATMREAIIVMVLKLDKNPKEMVLYGSLSMINGYRTILALLLTNRLLPRM